MLQVDRFSKNFGGLRALSGISFQVDEGEIVGLIGPNGSGKSTAFNVITGFLPATSGTVTFNGEDITRLPAHKVAKRGLARTFQLVRPFMHLTTLENVLTGRMFGNAGMPSRKLAEPGAYKVLEQVGLADKAGGLARDLTVMERKWLIHVFRTAIVAESTTECTWSLEALGQTDDRKVSDVAASIRTVLRCRFYP
jgi:ABC-type branched-subunit amino acid transport system ATPase component